MIRGTIALRDAHLGSSAKAAACASGDEPAAVDGGGCVDIFFVYVSRSQRYPEGRSDIAVSSTRSRDVLSLEPNCSPLLYSAYLRSIIY